MKKGQAILLIMNIVLIAISIFNAITHILNDYTLAFFLFTFFIVAYKYFGIESNNKHYNVDILFNILIGCFLYTVITYLLGLWLGFLSSPYSFTLSKLVVRTIPVILTIILSELIRFIFVTKGIKYKNILILSTISFILIDITLLTKIYNFSINKDLLEFSLILMGVITKNIFLTYLSFKTDYKAPIVYRLYVELPIYILPIFPNLGKYIDTLINFLLPIIFLYITYISLKKEIKEKEKITPRPTSKIRKTTETLIFIIFVFSFIGITCGWFKYYSLVVGSGSMSPNINKGDVVIVEKLSREEQKKLKIGDVLIFKYKDTVIIHRIVKIEKDLFYTKGDYNRENDNYSIKKNDVIGTTKARIPIIGYPVVWLSDALKK